MTQLLTTIRLAVFAVGGMVCAPARAASRMVKIRQPGTYRRMAGDLANTARPGLTRMVLAVPTNFRVAADKNGGAWVPFTYSPSQ